MTEYDHLAGMALERALAILRADGLSPQVIMTASPRRPAEGTARVLCVEGGGRRVVAARFPDQVSGGEEKTR